MSVEKGGEKMEGEVKDLDFDGVDRGSGSGWEEEVCSISVEGGSEGEKEKFYSGMYEGMVVGNMVKDVNGEYGGEEMEIGKLGIGRME